MVSPSPVLEYRIRNTEQLLLDTGSDVQIVNDYAIAYPDDYINIYDYQYLMVNRPWKVDNTFNTEISPESVYTNSDKVLIICVDFSDKQSQTPIQKIRDIFFGTTGNTFVNFYKENSYGQYIPSGQLVGWYRLPQTYSYYNSNGSQMAIDALEKAKNDINVNDLDVDHDGKLERLIILRAGSEAAWTGNPNDIWSYTRVSGFSYMVNGKTFTKFTTISEYMTSPSNPQRCGVSVHEFGHILGMPDLYDTNRITCGAGMWTVMSFGSWGGLPTYKQSPDDPNSSGIWPVHFDPWCKNILGWTTFKDNITGTNIQLKNIENNGDSYLRYTTSDPNKHFILENRQKTLFDTWLPGSGILIWRINEDKITGYKGNDDPNCFAVGVLQADGLKELENNSCYTNRSQPGGTGDDGDPYPGLSNNRSFGKNTNPSTILCTGSYLDLLIDQISNSSMTMTIRSTIGGTSCPLPSCNLTI